MDKIDIKAIRARSEEPDEARVDIPAMADWIEEAAVILDELHDDETDAYPCTEEHCVACRGRVLLNRLG